MEDNQVGWDRFAYHVCFEVENVEQMRLQDDRWCGDQPLIEKYPLLYTLAPDQNALVSSYLVCSAKGWESHWDVQWIKQFNDWELDGVASMLGLLYSCLPRSLGPDRLGWNLRGIGVFDVRSYYGVLHVPRKIIFFMERNLVCQSPMVSSFQWTANWEKILTNDNLIKRGFTIVNWFCMFRSSGELVDHLLLQCDFYLMHCGAMFLVSLEYIG